MPSPELKIITATWRTPLLDDLWEKLKGLKSRASEEGDFVSLGPALPEDQERRIAEVVVHRQADVGELRWALSVRPTPSSEAPESVKENDRKLGGRRGLGSLLAEAITSGVPAVGSFRLRLSFAETDFSCGVIPTAIKKGAGHDGALLLGHGPRLEQVGYRFEGGGAGGIEEVTLVYDHEEKRYLATVGATGPLKLDSPLWLPYADDIGGLVQSAFFTNNEGRS